MPGSPLQNPHLDGSPFLHPGGPVGALLIHGYTATVAEVRLLGEYLAQQGLTVSAPLLPGHGTTPAEMSRCRWQDWAVHVECAYQDLKARCPTVFVGGESMGGLLTLHLAASHPEIAGLMTYAAVLVAANKNIRFAPLLQYFIREIPKNRGKRDPERPVHQRWQGYTVDVVPSAAQLLALQRVVRRELGRVTQPLLIFQGRLDETVDPRSASLILNSVGSQDKELVWMERSTHCLLLDVEWENAAAQTLAFIRRIAGALK